MSPYVVVEHGASDSPVAARRPGRLRVFNSPDRSPVSRSRRHPCGCLSHHCANTWGMGPSTGRRNHHRHRQVRPVRTGHCGVNVSSTLEPRTRKPCRPCPAGRRSGDSRCPCGGGEQEEFFGAVGARVRVVDDKRLSCRSVDAQPLRFSRRPPTWGWSMCSGEPSHASTSWRAQSRLKRGLARQSSPTSSMNRGSSMSVPTDSRETSDHAPGRALQSGGGPARQGRDGARSRLAPATRRGDRAVARALAARTSK